MITARCKNCGSTRVYPTLIYGYIGNKPVTADKLLYKCRKCRVIQYFKELEITV